MAIAERSADVSWTGDLAHGNGKLRFGSGAIPESPVTWASRTERSDGRTSPEELIAAAHASCFSMAFSNTLAEGGNPPERLDVSATCTLDKLDAGLRITTMELRVRGVVPGIDETAFTAAAEQAKDGCPVSNALVGNVAISLDAALEQ